MFDYLPADGRHFLAYHHDKLISHAMATTRWLQSEGQQPLKTAYVDAVSTLPEYQGQGYGSAVMRHLAAHIGDCEIACPETELPTFYERLGWPVTASRGYY